jgi:hypothetical protein
MIRMTVVTATAKDWPCESCGVVDGLVEFELALGERNTNGKVFRLCTACQQTMAVMLGALAARKGTCRSCGAAIVWITTKAGRSMPCDETVQTVLVGGSRLSDEVVVLVTMKGETIRGHRARPDSVGGTRLTGRVAHFATCPNWDRHWT